MEDKNIEYLCLYPSNNSIEGKYTLNDIMKHIIIRYNRNITNIIIYLSEIISGLTDTYIKIIEHKLKISYDVIGINTILNNNKNIKSFDLIQNIQIKQETLNIPILKKLINNVNFIDGNLITNSPLIDLQNFLNGKKCNKNGEKHVFGKRMKTSNLFTNILFPNYSLIDIIVSSQYPTIQFMNKINKINDEKYIIDITDDIFFKNRLYLFIKDEEKIYYPDRIEFRLSKKNELVIVGCIDKFIEVSNEDIVNALCCIFINLIKCIKLEHPDRKVIKNNEIIEMYNKIFIHNYEKFKELVKIHIEKIVEQLDSNYYFAIKADTIF